MKLAIAVLAAVSLTSGLEYDGFRVKFGLSNALVDKEYFFNLPRLASEAKAKDWKVTRRPHGPMPHLKMYCPPGRNVCPLYNAGGFLSGLQIAIPVEGFNHPPSWSPEKKLVKWTAPAANGEPKKEYWTATQFYVTEESLEEGTGPTKKNGSTLQEGGVWVAGLNGHLMKIPTSEDQLASTLWKKQNCIPGMGTHYYYNMTPELQCENLYNWFVTSIQSKVVSVGFQIVGNIPQQTPNWFESIPKGSAQVTIPLAPQCLYDDTDKYDVISLHIYFIDKPWTIECKDSDSIKKLSLINKMKLKGAEIVEKVTGEFKKLVD